MARDALAEDPAGTFPAFPRRPDGSPNFTLAWGVPGANEEYDANGRTRAPSGEIFVRDRHGNRVRVDLALRYPVDHPRAGEPIVPPTIPPGGTP